MKETDISILLTVWHLPRAQGSEFSFSFATPLPQSYHEVLETVGEKEKTPQCSAWKKHYFLSFPGRFHPG